MTFFRLKFEDFRSLFATYWIEITALSLYFLVLFPGRLNPDVEKSIALMQSGESTANWSAIYFRILQVLSFNGKTIAFASLTGLIVFFYSVHFFIGKSVLSMGHKKAIFRLLALTPFIPIFSLTVQHDVFAWSGTLIVIAYLLDGNRIDYSNYKDALRLVLVVICCSTSFIGIFCLVGFIFSLLIRRDYRAGWLILVCTVMIQVGSLFLGVAKAEPALKYIPLLGDLKCIAQDSDSRISPSEWQFLESLAPRENWETQESCLYADNAIFAYWEAGKIPVTDFILNWAKIGIDNPRILLLAHIHRSSQALPPPFFRGQPNATTTDYFIPIGSNTKRSLQVFNEVIIDAPLNGEFTRQQLPILSKLEPVVLMGAFVFNQNSMFWGWGGLWISVFAIYLLLFTRFSLIALMPIAFQMILLIGFSPLPDPRYVFGWIVMGLVSGTSAILTVSTWIRNRTDNRTQ